MADLAGVRQKEKPLFAYKVVSAPSEKEALEMTLDKWVLDGWWFVAVVESSQSIIFARAIPAAVEQEVEPPPPAEPKVSSVNSWLHSKKVSVLKAIGGN